MPLVNHTENFGRNFRPLKLIIAVFLLVALGFSGLKFVKSTRSESRLSATVPPKIEKPHPVSIESRDLFFGTTFWGRYINKWSQQSALKEAYPFSRLKELKRSNYDAWIANLECPTIPGLSLTPAQEEATLSFNCPPTYLPEAAKWFTVFGSANNHSDNQGGEEGLLTTRKQLAKNHIQYFGNFDPEKLEDVCEIISMPAQIKMSDSSTQKGFLPVAMCGYHGVFKIPSNESLAVMRLYSKYVPVIAYPHAGAEYKAAPDEIKTNLYRSMIDNGADMVLGDHPHWVQNTESYKGKLIVYSMGNFIFDQQSSVEVTRGAAIKLLIKSKNADPDLLAKWLDISRTCQKFHDDCLSQAKAQKLTRLPLTFGFDFVATDNSEKIVKLASQAQRAATEQRLNWANTMKGLQAPYYGL
jgi:poly-gamma-glutamate synthesis protein (capsule biosynthesis protein)